MAIDIERVIMDGMLDLCKNKLLREVTVSQILKETGVSRGAFYQHFHDKNDLISAIYRDKSCAKWSLEQPDSGGDFHKNTEEYLAGLEEWRTFFSQAITEQGQNNLKEYVMDYTRKWETACFAHLYPKGIKESERLYMMIDYHAWGHANQLCIWLTQKHPVSSERMARVVSDIRNNVFREYLPK